MIALHRDQERYRDELHTLTGWDRDVLGAWIAAASGPGVRVTGHGYLTPGQHFPDVPTAARAAAALLDRHQLAGLNVTGPLRQLTAVGEHPELPGTTDTIVRTYLEAQRNG